MLALCQRLFANIKLMRENRARSLPKKNTHAALVRAVAWEDKKRVVVRCPAAESAEGGADAASSGLLLITCSQSFSLCQLNDAKWAEITQHARGLVGTGEEVALQIYKMVQAARRKSAPLVTVEEVPQPCKNNSSQPNKRGRKKAKLPPTTSNPALAKLAHEYYQLCTACAAAARDLKVCRKEAQELEADAVAEMRRKGKVEKTATSSLLDGEKFKLVLRVRDSRPKLPAKEIQSLVRESVNQVVDDNGKIDAALAVAKIRDALSSKHRRLCNAESEEEDDDGDEPELSVEEAPLDQLTIKLVPLPKSK